MPVADLMIGGDVAIVTAAGRGIGYKVASQLTENGVNVVINDLDEERLVDAEKSLSDNEGSVASVAGDVSEPTTAEELVAMAVDKFGKIDILVNNVGIAGPTKSCEELTKEEFMETLEVDVVGIFAPTSAAIPYLKESDAGRVVNLSSMTGKNPLPNRTPYCAAKSAVIGFTRGLALELSEFGVTVNAICPGSVWGDRLKGTYERMAEMRDKTIEEIKSESLEDAPLNEFIEPDDIADTVLYLCSTRAAKVTGQDLNVTSGKVMY